MVPYNEKVYATDLGRLDVEAMGRFFPHADRDAILAGLGAPAPPTYNSTFVYPRDGAAEFVRALHGAVPPGRTLLGEPVVGIDLRRHLAHTTRRTIEYESLVSSVPLPNLLALAGLPHDPGLYAYNKVLVFNLGFDRKGLEDVHWIYVPDPEVSFYRVGFYDNVWPSDRMSLYVEIGCRADEPLTRPTWLSDGRASWPTWSARASSRGTTWWRPTTSCSTRPTSTSPAPRRRTSRRSGPR